MVCAGSRFVTGAFTVLKDEQSVAAQAADDWARGCAPHRPLRNADFVYQRIRQSHPQLFLEGYRTQRQPGRFLKLRGIAA